MLNGGLTEQVTYRETSRILAILDRICKSRSCDRADLIREAIRFYLASNAHLTQEEKKDLGVSRNAT